jgi:hypothetical protein
MRVGVCRLGGGLHCATIGFPAVGYSVQAIGASGPDALHRTAAAAESVFDFLESHPELVGLVSPQAALALKTIKIVAWAIKMGYAKDAAEAMAKIASGTIEGAEAAGKAVAQGAEAAARGVAEGAEDAAGAVSSLFSRLFGGGASSPRGSDHR